MSCEDHARGSRTQFDDRNSSKLLSKKIETIFSGRCRRHSTLLFSAAASLADMWKNCSGWVKRIILGGELDFTLTTVLRPPPSSRAYVWFKSGSSLQHNTFEVDETLSDNYVVLIMTVVESCSSQCGIFESKKLRKSFQLLPVQKCI